MRLLNRFLVTYEALYSIAETLSAGEQLDESVDASSTTQTLALQTAQKMTVILERNLYSGDPAEQPLMNELRYILAALVDEMLLFQINWSGKKYWCDHLLEEKLFGTSIAGRMIFQRIKTLGKRHGDPSDKDQFASIYLMLLQLGFYGECRHQRERLTEYQVMLNRLRFQPGLPPLAFAQAYEHPLSGAYPQTLGAMSRWWRWVGVALAVYLVLALIIWVSAVQIFAGIYDEQITDAAKIELRITTDEAEPAASEIDSTATLAQRRGDL